MKEEQDGSSPGQFQNVIRVYRAKELLASTGLGVSEIAEQTGFERINFIRVSSKKMTALQQLTAQRKKGLNDNRYFAIHDVLNSVPQKQR